MTADRSLSSLCGQLIVGGFAGTELSPTFREALGRGERGGAILFRRNITGSLADVLTLTRSIAAAAPADLPPLIAVDQEGGRVTRLGPPVLRLPPMRAFGRINDTSLVRRSAHALGAELAALGFTMDFAPVLDVDTCPINPIIGDRSFSADADVVAAMGAAYASGLQQGGVLACGKHFPGHGDTTVDSHLELPCVDAALSRLEAVELTPFRHLRANVCSSVMSAHVVYSSLDPAMPATLSRRIAHDLLRGELGFDGLLVSDDLEMKAVFGRFTIEQSAVLAVRAGCDVILVCSSEELQARAHAALVDAAASDDRFRAQVEASVARALRFRTQHPPQPLSDELLATVVGGPESRAIARELHDLGAFA